MIKIIGLLAMTIIMLVACRTQGLLQEAATPVARIEADITTPDLHPTPTPPALRFVLPTMGAEPVSGWRPPLYPIPWAVSPHDHFYFARPIAANKVNWPLADYRYGGIFFRPDIVHTGVDIPDDEGTPVLAAGPGTVVWAGWGLFSGYTENEQDPYGQAVAIRHDFGYHDQPLYTIYAHMKEVDVTLGEWVDTGDQLGLVGNTGFTTGPHLHFEVRLGKNTFYQTYNPELWMAPPQGWGVLVGRVRNTKLQAMRHYEVFVKSWESGEMRMVKTYGGETVNSDPYYNENMVLSDLPAGWYKIMIDYGYKSMDMDVRIYPGQVTYFTFQGYLGFTTDTPPTPNLKSLTPAP